MREATYTDDLGRKFLMRLPEGVSDDDSHLGIVVGPPPLDTLLERGMSQEVMVRLHNQLFARRIYSEREFRLRTEEVVASLQAAYMLDVQTLHELFVSAAQVHDDYREVPIPIAPEMLHPQWKQGPSQPQKQAERNPGALETVEETPDLRSQARPRGR